MPEIPQSVAVTFQNSGIVSKSTADEIAITAYARLSNVTTSLEGSLNSRYGFSRVASGLNNVPRGFSYLRHTNGAGYRYALADNGGTSQLYVANNSGGAYAAVTGGSGMHATNRPFFAVHTEVGSVSAPYLFFADGQVFRRVNPVLDSGYARNVGIPKPTAAATIVLASVTTTAIDAMETAASWTASNCTLSDVTGQTSNGMRIAVSGPSETGVASKNATVNLGAFNSSPIEFWLKFPTAADALAVQEVVISFSLGDTGYTTRFEKAVLPSELEPATQTGSTGRTQGYDERREEQRLFDAYDEGDLSDGQVAENPVSGPPGFGVFNRIRIPKDEFLRVGKSGTTAPTLTWASVQAIRIEVRTTSSASGTINVDVDEMLLRTQGELVGANYSYVYTYANTVTGSESDYSPAVDVPYPGADHDQYTLTFEVAPSVSPEAPFVDRIRLYRIGGTVEQYQKVTDVTYVAAAQATYTDNIPDTALGDVIDTDNQTPPAGVRGVAAHDERLWIWGATADAPNKLRFSKKNMVESFPEDFYMFIGNGSERILTCLPHDGELLVFTLNKVYRIPGSDEDTYRAVETNVNQSLRSPFGVVRGLNSVYMHCYDGIYEFPSGKKISEAINPVFHGEQINSIIPVAVSAAAQDAVAVGFADSKVYFSYPSTGQTANDKTVVYDVLYQRWHYYTYGVTQFFFEPDQNILIGGIPSCTGYAMRIDNGFADVTNASTDGIALVVETKDFDMGAPDREKRFIDLVADANAQAATITVEASFDGASYVTLGTITGSTRIQTVLPVPTSAGASQLARRMQLKLSGTTDPNATDLLRLYKVVPRFFMEPMRHRSYLTDWSDLGYEGTKIIRELHIEMDTFNQALTSIQVEVDGASPAGGLINAANGYTVTANGKTKFYYALGVDVKGSIVRLKVTPSGTNEVKVYNYEIRFIQEGDAITKFQSPWSDEGAPHQRKRFRKLLLEVDNIGSGAVTVDFQADNSSVTPVPATITSGQTGRRQFSFAMPIDTVGVLWRVVLTGAASTTFKAYKWWVEAIPEPFQEARFESQWSNYGTEGLKRARNLLVEADTGGSDVVVTVWMDGAALAGTFTLNTSTRQRKVFALPLDTLFKIGRITASSASNTPFTLYSHNVTYLDEAALDSTIQETQWADEGWPYLKLWRHFTINVENSTGSNATATLWLDGAATAQTFTIPSATGQRLYTFSFARDTIGKLARVVVTGVVTKLYKIQYVIERLPPDLIIHDSYESVLSFDRIKVLRRLWLSYKAPADITMTVYTDELLSYSHTVPASNPVSGYTKIKIDLPSAIKGKLIRLVMTSGTRFQVWWEQSEFEMMGLNPEDGFSRVRLEPPKTY